MNVPQPLSLRLREGTRAAHDAVDSGIMRLRPFESRARYAGLVQVNHALFRLASPLYRDPDLGRIFPDLAARDRSEAARQDLADLGAAPLAEPSRDAPAPDDLPAAAGWLYVTEGSTLGAAVLLKRAASLGVGADRGARHLAPAAEGARQHWTAFVDALDALGLDEAEITRAVAAARDAFAVTQAFVERLDAGAPAAGVG